MITPIELTFDVTNVSGIEKTANYAVDVPEGWSAAVLSVANSTLADTDDIATGVDETKATVTVTVTPPAGAASGDNSIVLKTTVGNTTTQTIATINMPAALDLDQVGDGNAATINSGEYDRGEPSFSGR